MLALLVGCVLAPAAAAQGIDQLATGGTGPIAADGAGSFYVTGHGVVERRSSLGVLQASWTAGPADSPVQIDARGSDVVLGWGTGVSANVGLYTPAGAFVRAIGAAGGGAGQYTAPAAVASGGGFTYVADHTLCRVMQYATADGSFVRTIIDDASAPTPLNCGALPGLDVAAASNGDVYVAQAGIVWHFNSGGTLLGQVSIFVSGQRTWVATAPAGVYILSEGSSVVPSQVDSFDAALTPGSRVTFADERLGPDLAADANAVYTAGTTDGVVLRIEPGVPSTPTIQYFFRLLATNATTPFTTIAGVDFDLNDDGTYDRTTTSTTLSDPFPIVHHVVTRHVGVRVRTVAGGSATAKATIRQEATPPKGSVGVSIFHGRRAVNRRNTTLSLVWPEPTRASARISHDGGFNTFVRRSLAPTVKWTLEPGADGVRTVYLRFGGSDTVYSDTIVLDRRRPHVTRATARTLARKNGVRRYRIAIAGADSRTGIASAEVSTDRKHRHSAARGKAIILATNRSRVFVRVKDGAGNLSAWTTLQLPTVG